MLKTIKRWWLQRKIKKSEDDLRFLKEMPKDNPRYGDCQVLIPYAENELAELYKQLILG